MYSYVQHRRLRRLYIGYAIADAGTIGWPLALTAVPFAFGLWLAYLAPETTGEVLPE